MLFHFGCHGALHAKEAWYYVAAANKFEQENSVKDSTKLSAKASLDQPLMDAIIGDEGFMRAGAMPSLPCATKQGSQKLLQAVSASQAIF